MIRELGSCNLSFNEEAVSILFLQSAWQAGEGQGSDPLRKAHSQLRQNHLCTMLHDHLERFLQQIQANWWEQWSMYTIIVLALQGMSLTSRNPARQGFLNILRQARTILLGWRESLRRSGEDRKGDAKGSWWRAALFEAAITSLTTFDVEPNDLRAVLIDYKDLKSFFLSQILTHNNAPANLASLGRWTRSRLIITHKTGFNAEHALRRSLSGSVQGLDDAIRTVWAAASLDGPWKYMTGDQDRWL